MVSVVSSMKQEPPPFRNNPLISSTPNRKFRRLSGPISSDKHRAREPRTLTPRVGPRMCPRVGPRKRPPQRPRECPRECPRTLTSLFRPFEDSPRKGHKTSHEGVHGKCPRKWSVFTCPVFTCSVRCPYNPTYRAILRDYRCDTPYRSIPCRGGWHSPKMVRSPPPWVSHRPILQHVAR